jgi:hypothetical protein
VTAGLTQPTYQPRLIAHWQSPERDAQPAAAHPGQRYALLVPGEVQAVTLAITGEALPWLGMTLDHLRHPWHKFELPGLEPVSPSPPSPRQGQAVAPSDAEPGRLDLRIHLADGSRRHWSIDPPTDRRASEAIDAERRALAHLADRRWSLIGRLQRDQQQAASVFRAGVTGEGLAVPLDRLAALWPHQHAQPPARHELLRTWAPRLERAIKQIAHQPHTRLVRRREVVGANHAQHFDARCVRWLARQPGATAAEKAGTRQRVLAITRHETLDTLENRAAAMVIRAVEHECRQALTEREGTGEPTSANQLAADDDAPLRRLLGVIDRARRDSPVPALPSPDQAVRANHVLRSDPAYRLLWRTHLELRHRDQRRAAAWRWRHRLWAETCVLALAARLEQRYPGSPAGRACVVFRRHPEKGRWIDPTTAFGRWETGSAHAPASLLMVERRDLDHFRHTPLVPEPLIAMNPDGVLIHREANLTDEREATVVGIWTQWTEPDNADPTPALQRRCEATAHQLMQIHTAGQLRGLILEPRLNDDETPAAPITTRADPRGRLPHGQGSVPGSCWGLKMPLPLTEGWAAFDQTLEALLG